MACLGAGLTVVTQAPSADAATRLTLATPRVDDAAVVLRGRAPARSKVQLVRRTSDGWKKVATDRADRRGRYRVRIAPPTRSTWVVRAVSGDLRSGRRRIVPTAPTVPPADGGLQLDDSTAAPPPGTEPTPEPAPAPPSDACGQQPEKADGTRWECTFVDDFTGTSLDTTKWLTQQTSLSGMRIGPGCFTGDAQTLAVSDGALRLSAQHTASSFTCNSPYGGFSTDRAISAVTTKGRFNQAYGRFEFRAKMPETRVAGAHSALWLYPDRHLYGAWPLSGEIDVAEWYSAIPGKVYPSLHYVDGLKNVQSGQRGLIEDVSRFHTYAVEWTPTTMRFLYDGAQVYQQSWTPLSPLVGAQPFDKPFNVVLTQAWGQLWNAPTAATPDRVTMTVDWVKVWK